MKLLKTYIFLFCTITAITLFFNVYAKTNTIITLPDGSIYDISYLGHNNTEWYYTINEIEDSESKDLSHFTLGICNIISVSPEGYELGIDPTTNITGIKYNTPSEFFSTTITVTVDAIYEPTLIDVAAKAGNLENIGYGQVFGPNCNKVIVPTISTVPTVISEPTITNTITLIPITVTVITTPIPTNTIEIPIENTPTLVLIPTEDTPTPTKTISVTVEPPTNIEDGTLEPKNIPNKRQYLPVINK